MQPGMSGIQALAAAAAATSKINTPGTPTTLTTSSGQAIKLIQQPGSGLNRMAGVSSEPVKKKSILWGNILIRGWG
jgi:hypothetical protein